MKDKPRLQINWECGNGYIMFNEAALSLLKVNRKKAPGKVALEKSKPKFVMFFKSTLGVGFVTINKEELNKYPATPILYEPRLNAYGTQPYAPNVPTLLSLLGVKPMNGVWEAVIEKRVINKKEIFFITGVHGITD